MERKYFQNCSINKIKGIKVIDLDKLEIHDKLGEGAYGKVRLVRYRENSLKSNKEQASTDDESHSTSSNEEKKQNNKTTVLQVLKNQMQTQKERYAVKMVSKKQLIDSKQVGHINNEIRIMAKLDSPFIAKLRGVAQDSKQLYLLLDYFEHGELMNVITQQKKLPYDLAKFYIAQILLALEYMHDQQILFRDLKPENVLLERSGYIQLTDLGFAKKIDKGKVTYTVCGTPEYMAPEIITNKGYAKAADYYALGIMLYEMTVGRCPYMSSNPYKIFQMAINEKLRFPREYSQDCKSLIKHLVDHDLSKRYGNLIGGSQQIKEHRFMKTLNFDRIVRQTMNPPYIPKQKEQKKLYNGSHLSHVQDFNQRQAVDTKVDPFLDWW